jgi:hypothetical protein
MIHRARRTRTMESEIEYIEGRHNPEHDASSVSWVDMRLLALIEKLNKKVEKLEKEVQHLKNRDRVLT